LREEQIFLLSQNRMLRRIFGLKREDVREFTRKGGGILQNYTTLQST
jgi:hypothetical protein